MLLLFFQLGIEAFILMGLLQMISKEEIGFGMAMLVGFGASLFTGIVGSVLITLLGIFGLIPAAAIGAAGVGCAVSALYGIEIKRAFLIGAIFLVVHIVLGFTIELVFS